MTASANQPLAPQTAPAAIPQLPPEPPSALHEDKLYLVTRDDLSVGYQIAQTAHACADFLALNPDAGRSWHAISNSLIVLTARDEAALYELLERARSRGVSTTGFREPDLGDELTAVAFHPSPQTRKLLSNLPLAGRRVREQQPLLAREARYRAMSAEMRDCEQTAGQDVLAHGRSVREHYFSLVEHLEGRLDLSDAPNWRLPTWLDEHREQLLQALPARHVMGTYLTLHDAGKPAVRTVGDDGRVRFPGHAQASVATYRQAADDTADPLVAELIAGDMDIHLASAADLHEFARRETAVAHLLAGLAEVTSNADMFGGGIDSTGFKIKWKHLDKRGRALCRLLFPDQPVQDRSASSPGAPDQRAVVASARGSR